MEQSKGKVFYLSVFALIVGFGILGTRVQAGGERFYSDLIRLDKVVTKINEHYVENVTSAELVDAAIDGIRGILDPHTAYFTPEDYEDLKVNTEGEFGGLGIQIGIRDRMLTVISPLQGTPAHRMGLQSGDKITRIDTASTQDITIDEAVGKLRGKPGTSVRIQVSRQGQIEPMEFTIVREVIKIESVPYAGMLNDTVAYVKITQFAKSTSEDLEAHILELKKKHAPKALILDLRVNPGGLLNQAISVSELFLQKGQKVVYTQGRVKSQNQEYVSKRKPIWTEKVVVLVNGNSASASEIVAGAIQDWDRGLILGETTYGKGSVQTILPLDGQQNTLKLTTAYYYTPAGRNINKPENGVRLHNGEDSVKNADTSFFFTKAGRKVLANGGITPDIKVKGREYNRFSQELLRHTLFFNYVVKNRKDLTQGKRVTSDLEITPAMLENFRKFVFSDSSFAQYKSGPLVALENFHSVLKRDKAKTPEDTLRVKLDDEVLAAMGGLEKQLKIEAAKEFEKNLDFIKYQLKAEIIGAALGEEARTEFELKNDEQVQAAKRYLLDPKIYTQALTKGNKG